MPLERKRAGGNACPTKSPNTCNQVKCLQQGHWLRWGRRFRLPANLLTLSCFLWTPATWAYPLDGAASTGIRRLTGYRLVNDGKIRGAVKLPPGAMLRSDQIVLRLKSVNPGFD